MKAPGIPVPSNAFPAEHSRAVKTGGVHTASTILRLQSESEIDSPGARAFAVMESLEFKVRPVMVQVPPEVVVVPADTPFMNNSMDVPSASEVVPETETSLTDIGPLIPGQSDLSPHKPKRRSFGEHGF